MSAFVFPIDVFPPGTFQIWRANTRVSAGATLAGAGQDADWSGGGLWAGEMTDFMVSTDAQHLAWCALATRLDDGLTEVVVPLVSGHPRPIGGATEDTMSFQANTAANLNATVIPIHVIAGGPIIAGHRFTAVHATAGERLYSIFEAGAVVSGVQTVKIRPPLREALTSGMALDFKTPRLLMKVVSSGKDLWPKVSPPYRARPQIQLVESFAYLDGLA